MNPPIEDQVPESREEPGSHNVTASISRGRILPLRGFPRNTALRVLDQIVSGLSNVLFSLIAVSVGTPTEFGIVSAAMVAVTSVLLVSRTSLGNCVLVEASRESGTNAARFASGFLICSAPLSIAIVAGAAWFSGAAQVPGIAPILAVAVPIVLVQDLLRFQSSAIGRPQWALLADLVWLLSLLPVVVMRALPGVSVGIMAAVISWACGALFSAIILATSLSVAPRFRGLVAWVRVQWRSLAGTAVGATASSTANVGRVSLIGATLGPTAVAALSAGQLLMAPLSLLAALIPFAATPFIVRRAGSFSPFRAYARVAGACCLIGLIWFAICSQVPASLGSRLLGEMWGPARALLPQMTLLSLAVLVQASALFLLFYMRQPRAFAAVLIVTSGLSLTLTFLVIRLGGQVAELAWAETAKVWFGAALCWGLALRLRRTAPMVPTTEGPEYREQGG